MAKKKIVDNIIRLSFEQLDNLYSEAEKYINDYDDCTVDYAWIDIWKEDEIIEYSINYTYTHSDTNTKYGEIK
jgi:hypothetical protein